MFVRSLVAVAGLATAATAVAQSSVTLFGIVDASYARTSAGGVSRTGITNSGLNSSRIGFRGTEDLGGGMKAGFWLEGALSNDDGNAAGLNFQRRSFVSLTTPLGEVRLGREYTPTFWNTTVYDPFGTNGIGQANSPAMLGAPVRANNSVSYLFAANGFDLHAMGAFGENPSNNLNAPRGPGQNTGNYFGARVGYAAGPLSTHFATGRVAGGNDTLDVTVTNFGLAYNLGFVRPMIGFGSESTGVQSANTGQKLGTHKVTYTELGATAPMGAGQLRIAYSLYNRTHTQTPALSDNDWNKFAVGYGYDLSKRTQVYGTYAKVSNKGASTVGVNNNGLTGAVAAPGGGSSGIEIGVRHTF